MTLGTFDARIDFFLRQVIAELDTDRVKDVYAGCYSFLFRGIYDFHEESLIRREITESTDSVFNITLWLGNDDIVSFWVSNKYYGYATDIEYYKKEDIAEARLDGSLVQPCKFIYDLTHKLKSFRRRNEAYCGNWITLRRLDRSIDSYIERNRLT